MTKKRQLLEMINRIKSNDGPYTHSDPYRPAYHLSPPFGLMNDPNGLIYFKGRFHVFFQWNPFETDHSTKVWGHFSSTDLLHWEGHPPALVPGEWYDRNGCYSGSAIEHDGKMYLFYTGNVKKLNGERESYQCLAISEDGIHFEKKGPILHVPKGYTSHFRDPKVWRHNEHWYMVLGAQSDAFLGRAVLFSSTDFYHWQMLGPIAGSHWNHSGDLGYMWECPDFFHLQGKDILLFCPQGLEPKGMNYNNLYQSGYLAGRWIPGTNHYEHGEFRELDRGFDFYAPQTFVDPKMRRILIAWMGMGDENERYHPTVEKGWIHALTLPRELKVIGDHLYQTPIDEIQNLRRGEPIRMHIDMNRDHSEYSATISPHSEIIVHVHSLTSVPLKITIRNNIQLSYDTDHGIFTLRRKKFNGNQYESRQCMIGKLSKLQIFLDSSSVEVFINDGQEVFTARFFADPEDHSFLIASDSQATVDLQIYSLLASYPVFR
ncbi:glycoside hydrolase family 32 protein [Caldibacillus debilis]|uniref:glycoside hydrolase family 32 protein n=1 Tax=Caldibacillus debilis TaxID=301148 RepID=UPI000B55A66F|nr:sucrose-6-phosphate hydrolase [Caldibacillus debilis]OUM92343.1 MAG: sucrose-6-phosphate hydrolase [Caldibacillus debilis]